MLLQDVDAGVASRADHVRIGAVDLLRLNRESAIGYIRSAVLLGRPIDIAICNAHTILSALDDADYAAALRKMTLINDGIGVNLASKYLHGYGFPDNLNGTDLIPAVLAEVGVPLRIYLLGARENEVQRARKHIEALYPLHTVVGARNGYFSDPDIPSVCDEISNAKADLLLVAMGNPRQEKFIVENRALINSTVAIGVGALFDFMSGSVVRAPQVVQALGLEWLFRLVQEPRRLFKRYVVGIPRFMLAVHRQKRGEA
ncbi:WecB/TagA/CpsF family glycosyltransferase [Roseibium sp.]|uniref:WecB/TagA/CpsF family glycosyltransferase n=1 Tax=Roseibium sp. TaxID=1936156 RepID=UPI003A983CFC